jgi:hypothetical protein
MPRGRPTSYTPERGHAIAVHLRYACPLEVAAQAEGVSVATVRQWLVRYPEFAAEVAQARGRCVVQLLGYLNRAAAQGNWKAAAWLLERTHPQDYGPPPRRMALDAEINTIFSQMSDADLEAYVVKLGDPAALDLSDPVAAPLTSRPTPRDGSNGHHSGDDQDVLHARASPAATDD